MDQAVTRNLYPAAFAGLPWCSWTVSLAFDLTFLKRRSTSTSTAPARP